MPGFVDALDMRVAGWLHQQGTPPIAGFLFAVTTLHSLGGLAVMTAVFSTWLARLREWSWIGTAIAAVAGAALLNAGAKLLVHRPRPNTGEAWVVLTTYSFPSGHTASSTAFYGVLAAFLLSREPRPSRRLAICGFAAFAIALVGFSRMYLGAHYLSDIAGGAVLGGLWVVLCLALRRRARRHDEALRLSS